MSARRSAGDDRWSFTPDGGPHLRRPAELRSASQTCSLDVLLQRVGVAVDARSRCPHRQPSTHGHAPKPPRPRPRPLTRTRPAPRD
jgi:hypothetical protein